MVGPIEARVGLEGAVVTQQPERAGVLPGDVVSAFREGVGDAHEQLADLPGRPLVREARLRDELGESRVLVVAAARCVVVAGEAVEQGAGHRHLDANGRVGRAERRAGARQAVGAGVGPR